MVVDGDRLAGIVSLRDLLRFLSVKLDLEGGPDNRGSEVEQELRELQGV
jgi:hypothetical protein